MKKISDPIKYDLQHLHFYLSSISYYNNNIFGAEESLIEDCRFGELVRGEWDQEVLKSETLMLLKKFRTNWLQYKREKDYSENPLFVSIDPEWKRIVREDLIPALQAMELDMDQYQIEYAPILNNYKPDNFPPVEDILHAGSILYKSLLDNKIISKNYLDNLK